MPTLFLIFVASLVLLPGVTLLAGRSRARNIAPVLFIVALVAGIAAGALGFWRGDAAQLDLSGVAPLPFGLALDRLSSFFLLLICVVAAPVALFSTSYVESHYTPAKRSWFWTLLPWFVGSMVLVVTASTAFAFLFGWELMTLFSAGLILIEGDSEQRRHDLFIYLLMMHAGAAAVVASFLLFLPGAPGLGFAAMRAASANMPAGTRSALFILALVGFGAKAGLIPLHLWLPRAHPMAPSPVSALMSAVMLKTAVYGFVRVTFDIMGGGAAWWGYTVLIVGAISGVLGILYALAEHDLKRLLAYSSVENIGIIFMGLGASLIFLAHGAPRWATLALMGALLHAMNHAVFKGLLFLGAGAVGHSAHSLDLETLGGLQRRMPVSGAAFLIACCCTVGLPLGNGFVSEWLTFRSLLAGSGLTTVSSTVILPLMTGALALIGGLAAACFAKVYGMAFLGRPRRPGAEHAGEVPLPMRTAMAVMAVGCITIGVLPGLIFAPLTAALTTVIPGATVPPEAESLANALPWVGATIVLLFALMLGFRKAACVTKTWACGLPDLDERMQYTSTAFSKPLRTVFAQVYRPARSIEVSPPGATYFPSAITYHSARTTSFERTLYRPAINAIVAGAHRLRRLQTGNIQVYLLYIFLTLVALLMGLRFG